MLRRDPGKQEAWRLRSKPLRRTGIRQRSTKQAAKDRELAKVRPEAHDRAGHRCQMHEFMDGHHCDWRGLEVHHMLQRSQGGDHAVERLVVLCGAAHDWAHQHIEEASLFGLIVSAKWDAIRAVEAEYGERPR